MAENRGRFKPGNQAAYVHGGRSSKTVTSTAQERLRTEALQSYPWLANQPVLLGLLVSQRADVQHYAERVAEHEKFRRARQAQQSREHKAKAESLLLATLRQVEAARTNGGGVLPIPQWELGQFRMRMGMQYYLNDPADLEGLAKKRLELIGKGVPAALLPATPAEAHRVRQARNAEFARIKAENPALHPADAAAMVGLYVGYEGAVNE